MMMMMMMMMMTTILVVNTIMMMMTMVMIMIVSCQVGSNKGSQRKDKYAVFYHLYDNLSLLRDTPPLHTIRIYPLRRLHEFGNSPSSKVDLVPGPWSNLAYYSQRPNDVAFFSCPKFSAQMR
ncbi:hypothetical protein ElyMa_002656300 [Elysia marginata]|uniref:Uncharacterized protein n=1 Tax=Elysia marginata TaxID=1093978 RepID=A0AAV4H8D2_9GAST|nr:hypothetical protein ElyMa_002656300 [Elysia marginata]